MNTPNITWTTILITGIGAIYVPELAIPSLIISITYAIKSKKPLATLFWLSIALPPTLTILEPKLSPLMLYPLFWAILHTTKQICPQMFYTPKAKAKLIQNETKKWLNDL